SAAVRDPQYLTAYAGDTRVDVLQHRTHRGEPVLVAVVRVGDDRDRDGAGDHGGDPRDLGLGEEPHVGPALGHRHRVAAQIDAPHAGALGELRAERIVGAAGGPHTRAGQRRAEWPAAAV